MHTGYALFFAASIARPLLGSPTTRELRSRALNYGPVDENATCGARSLLTYLQKQYGNAYISGQQDAASLDWVTENIGKTPALQGNDFIDYSPSRVAFGASSHAVEDAVTHNTAGGINAFVWHWNAPTDLYNTATEPWWSGFYTAATSFNIQTALAEGPDGSDYQLILRDIDAIAVQIKRLSDSNIPILFRPLHEPDGGWFWWGAQGSAPFKQLWDILYDRLVNYHALHNMLWVCNTLKADWYPGNDKCDIATVDIYADAGDHSPQTQEYDSLNTLTGGARVLALAEVGEIPDPEQQHSQETPWVYWMTWSGTYISGGTYNSESFLETVYNDNYVVTLDGSNRLQDWQCGSIDSRRLEPNPSSALLLSQVTSTSVPSNNSIVANTSSLAVEATATAASSLSEYQEDDDECDASDSDEATPSAPQKAYRPASSASAVSDAPASSVSAVNDESASSASAVTGAPASSASAVTGAPASSASVVTGAPVSSASAVAQGTSHADQSGYILPTNGTASTTQFVIGTELAGGTGCGIDALPSGNAGSSPGTGPGFLYAAINQLAFGANPAGKFGPLLLGSMDLC